RQKILEYGLDMAKVISHPGNSQNFLRGGRLVHIKYEDLDFGWGIVANINKRQKPKHSNPDWNDHQKYIVQVILDVAPTTPMHLIRMFDPKLVPGVLPAKGDDFKTEVLPFTLESVAEISSLKVNLPNDLKNKKNRKALSMNLGKIMKKFKSKIPLLNPVKDMNINDDHFLQIIKKCEMLETKCSESPLVTEENFVSQYNVYDQKQKLYKEAEQITKQISDAQAILQMDELKSRKQVLRKLGFSTPEDVVELKGRVACEISSGDELLLTELIFNGTFSNLTPEQTAALLSCFVFDERVKEKNGGMHPDLKEPFKAVQSMAKEIAKVSAEAKLPVVEAEYVQQFQPEIMDVVYQWARGATFAQLCKMTDVFEGSLIRIFRRLEELLRQMSSAANTIGNEELAAKMDKALELIQRDLVSATSLYL
ncbi:hypothetical protein FF38_13680, partial [Lucilia cuprina]